jgi:methylenetetrahydrofolate dehydrogenase (NADP+)/methenyltetrahydrofolate cyclohydrolase
VVPQLAAVLVGDDPASAVYVRNKQIACRKAGFKSTLHHCGHGNPVRADGPGESLNADPDVPASSYSAAAEGLDATAILDAILPSKDVDDFMRKRGPDVGAVRGSCRAPRGVMRMLKVSGIATSGKHAYDRPQRHRRQA